MPKLINAFTLLNVQEPELKAWAVHQARALGLDAIASNHAQELLEATRITYAHLTALREDFLLDGADESPEWKL